MITETKGETHRLEKLLADYDQVHQTFRMLTDIRFRLLGLVPTVSGAVIGLLSATALGVTLEPIARLFVGGLGFVVTLGLVIYDLRNSQIYAAVIHRGKFLELALNLPPTEQPAVISPALTLLPALDARPGGIFIRRGKVVTRFLGVPIKHDQGTGLVYASVLAAWGFAAVGGVLGSTAGIFAGTAIGIVAFWLLKRSDQPAAVIKGLGYPPFDA